MKKKILTVSILLGITAIALVSYFVGCSQLASTIPEDKIEEAQQPVALDTAMKPLTLPDEGKKSVSEPQVTEKSLTKLSQLQKDVAEDEIRLRTQLEELVKAEDKERADILLKTDGSGIPHVTFQDGHALIFFTYQRF